MPTPSSIAGYLEVRHLPMDQLPADRPFNPWSAVNYPQTGLWLVPQAMISSASQEDALVIVNREANLTFSVQMTPQLRALLLESPPDPASAVVDVHRLLDQLITLNHGRDQQ